MLTGHNQSITPVCNLHIKTKLENGTVCDADNDGGKDREKYTLAIVMLRLDKLVQLGKVV